MEIWRPARRGASPNNSQSRSLSAIARCPVCTENLIRIPADEVFGTHNRSSGPAGIVTIPILTGLHHQYVRI